MKKMTLLFLAILLVLNVMGCEKKKDSTDKLQKLIDNGAHTAPPFIDKQN